MSKRMWRSHNIQHMWKRRTLLLIVSFIFMASAVGITLMVFNENITFFLTPTEILQSDVNVKKVVRLGGMIKEGSIITTLNGSTEFIITDFQSEVKIRYNGIIPGLFKEGSGTIALGSMEHDGVFIAKELLAKHDENYMPKEVAEALKKSGQWR